MIQSKLHKHLVVMLKVPLTSNIPFIESSSAERIQILDISIDAQHSVEFLKVALSNVERWKIQIDTGIDAQHCMAPNSW
jgi:hypothetical protein